MLSKNVRDIILKTGITLAMALTSVSAPIFLGETLAVEAATLLNQVSGELTVTADSLWTYSSADWSARTKVFHNGTKFQVLEKYQVDGREMYRLSNGLYITANPDYVRFDSSSTQDPVVAPTQINTARTTGNLNMRKGSGTSYGIILTIPKGQEVTVLSTSDGWSKVNYQGKTGYVSHKYLGSFKTTGSQSSSEIPPSQEIPNTGNFYTTTHNLNLRKGAGTNNGIILTIPKGSSIEVISSSGAWSKVDYKGKIGYVSNTYIVKNQTSPSVPSQPEEGQVAKTTGNLNLRTGGGTSYSIILTIPKGEEVIIHETSNGWSYVTYNGKTGYASRKYLNLVEAEKPIVPPKPVEPEKPVNPAPEVEQVQGIKKTLYNLNMRTGAGTSHNVILTIPKGAEVQVLKEESGWSKIIYSGKTGYSSSEYLSGFITNSPTEPNVPETEIPGTNINLSSILTINGLTYGGSNPTANTVVYGDALHGMGVKNVRYLVNGQVKGSVSFNQNTNAPEQYLTYPNYEQSGYFFTLKAADLNAVGMNSVSVVLTGNNGTEYSQSIILKGSSTDHFIEEAFGNSRDYYAQKEANNLSGDSRNYSLNAIQKAIDPGSYIHDLDKQYMYLDLRFDQNLNCSARELNTILAGKGVLDGKGQAFMDAAITYNVNPFYLVTHAIHETGHGTSVLAKGQKVTDTYTKFGDESTIVVGGVPEEDRDKLVYNVFGIGAYSRNPNLWGAQKAYIEKWFSVEDAISGGAKWISTYYIGAGQNDLFPLK